MIKVEVRDEPNGFSFRLIETDHERHESDWVGYESIVQLTDSFNTTWYAVTEYYEGVFPTITPFYITIGEQ